MQQALMSWCHDPQSEALLEGDGLKQVKEIKEILQQAQFWQRLNVLSRLLKPIHEQQIKSEAGKAHSGGVYLRSESIRAHLQRIMDDKDFPDEEEVFWSIYKRRQNQQLKDVHLLAFYLTPAPFTEIWQNREYSLL